MPRYDYECPQCGTCIEIRHDFNDSSHRLCRQCGDVLLRVIPITAVHLKGYGFYRTDHRSADEKYAFDHFDGSGTNAELKQMNRRITDPESTVPVKS